MNRGLRLVALCAMLFVICAGLCGCGGGSSSGTVAVPPVNPTAATGSVEAIVSRPGVAKDFPAGTASVRVHVQQDGADVVSPQTVPLPAAGQSVTVTFTGVPVGAATVVLEALDANGRSLDTSSTPVIVVAGQTSRAPVTVTVTSFAISPKAATAAPRASVTFTGVGGATPYAFSILTNASGATIDKATGVYTAGAKGGVQDVVLVTDASGGTASATVTVGSTLSISPATASVPVKGTQTFTTSGGSGTGVVWSIPTNVSGGTIDASGKYTAGVTGNVTDVVKAVDSLGNEATVSVTVGPIVQISPTTRTVAVGAQVSFAATGGSGVYQWTVSTNLSGGSVNAAGLYTAGPVGAVTDVVTVTDSLGNLATASVNVSQTLFVTPAAPSVAPKETVAFSASGGTAPYTFAFKTNASGGSVNAKGDYQAGTTPSVTDVVECTDGVGNKTTASVSVGPALKITALMSTIGPMGAHTFAATGGSATGLTWSLTANGSGAVINSSTGAYTAGLTTGVTDTVKVVDSLGNQDTLDVAVAGAITTPATATVAPSATMQFAPSGGSGSYLYSLPINESGATIDANGLYTAGAGGTDTLGYDVVLVRDANGGFPSATVVSVGGSFSVTMGGSHPRYVLGNGDVITIQALGGSGVGFTWQLPTNVSGSSVTPVPSTNRATLTAGPNEAINGDYVEVQDSLGNIGHVDLSIGQIVSTFMMNGAPSTNPLTIPSNTVVSLDGTGALSPVYHWQMVYNPTSATFANSSMPTTTFTPVVTTPTRCIISLFRNGHYALGTIDVNP